MVAVNPAIMSLMAKLAEKKCKSVNELNAQDLNEMMEMIKDAGAKESKSQCVDEHYFYMPLGRMSHRMPFEGGRICHFFEVLDPLISELAVAHCDKMNLGREKALEERILPALDLCSGNAMYPFVLSQRFRSLNVYPTDRDSGDGDGCDLTRKSLKHMRTVLQASQNTLFVDSMGTEVYVGSEIELYGLVAKPKFNGLHGTVIGPGKVDGQGELRYPVLLDPAEYASTVGGVLSMDDARKVFKSSSLKRVFQVGDDPAILKNAFEQSGADPRRVDCPGFHQNDDKYKGSISLETPQALDEYRRAAITRNYTQWSKTPQETKNVTGHVLRSIFTFDQADRFPMNVEGDNNISIVQDKLQIVDALIANVATVDVTKAGTLDVFLEQARPGTTGTRLRGTCALVTCLSLLTQVGSSQPDIWKQVMTCASSALAPQGILFMYDTTNYGGFGDVGSMQAHSEEQSLGLVLLKKVEPPAYDKLDTHAMTILAFRKL